MNINPVILWFKYCILICKMFGSSLTLASIKLLLWELLILITVFWKRLRRNAPIINSTKRKHAQLLIWSLRLMGNKVKCFCLPAGLLSSQSFYEASRWCYHSPEKTQFNIHLHFKISQLIIYIKPLEKSLCLNLLAAMDTNFKFQC